MLLLEALLLGGAAILRRPDITANESFLFADQGLNLLVADRLLQGGRLYVDIFSPYGPIPAYMHAAFAGVFGNTISSYNLLLLLLTLGNVALAYALLRTRVSLGVAAMVVGVGLVPSFLIPGSMLGGFTVSPYIPLERALLLTTALAWTPPGERTLLRGSVIGAILGVWQWVKFGGTFFAGAAILLVDIFAIALSHRRRELLRPWICSLGCTLAVFVLAEVLRVAVAYAALPAEVAFDFVWPAYHLEAYRAWVTPDQRWLAWDGWKLFLGQYLTPLVGAVLTVVGVVWYARGSLRSPSGARGAMGDLRLLLPAVFFALGSVAYFQQAHLFRQFMWALVLPSAFFLARSRLALRLLVLVLWLPCLAVNARAMLLGRPDPHLVAMELPGNDRVWTRPEVMEQVRGVMRELGIPRDDMGQAATARAGSVLFIPLGAGLHHFYDIPQPVRQPWISRGLVRPYDEAALVHSLDRLQAIVAVRNSDVAVRLPRDPCAFVHPSPFRGAFCQAAIPLLDDPIRVGPEFTVYPVRSSAGAGPDTGSPTAASPNAPEGTRSAEGGAISGAAPERTIHSRP